MVHTLRGSMGTSRNSPVIDKGTLCLAESCVPGTVCRSFRSTNAKERHHSQVQKLDTSKSNTPSSPATPSPQSPPPTNAGKTTVNGIEVTVLADGTDAVTGDKASLTSLVLDKGTTPGYEWYGKKIITKLKGPPPVINKATIQTVYNPNSKPTDISGYGRGTTTEDKKTGNVTIGFHESCHRQDFLDYIKTNVTPKFTGKVVGLTEDQYKVTVKEYFKAVDAYLNKAIKYSEQKTDEVGSPTLSQYKARKNP